MKKLLDYKCKEVVNIFDEVTLWSAPFGRLLLENIPMKSEAKIVDIGFGTGFPLIELSQRFGEKSKIYGIDIWEEGINRTKDKINTLELNNIELI
ncbi:MAG: class I SAM-dependent methyltransferase [Melioribacteraceae bacterium]